MEVKLVRIMTRQMREAELQTLVAAGSAGITAIAAILLGHKGGQGQLPADPREMIQEILDHEFPDS
jgi:hypothetical protein